MEILVVQHQDGGGAEAFGEALEAAGARLDARNIERGHGLPPGVDGFDALLVLGGVMNAHDDDAYPYLADVAALIRDFHGEARPVLGICLGAQLIARALGGRAYPHTVPELGFVPLTLDGEAAADPLLGGLESPLHVMQWHYQTFDLPPGARLLATGEACRNQIFRAGEATYAFQCHFEVTGAMVESWVGDGGKLPDDAVHNDFVATIGAQLERHIDGSLAFCREIAARWTALIAARRVA